MQDLRIFRNGAEPLIKTLNIEYSADFHAAQKLNVEFFMPSEQLTGLQDDEWIMTEGLYERRLLVLSWTHAKEFRVGMFGETEPTGVVKITFREAEKARLRSPLDVIIRRLNDAGA